MKSYFDSGLLVKLYIEEKDSEGTIELVRRYDPPILFTPLHETEIKNALRLKCFRKEISASALAQSLDAMEFDLNAGILERTLIDWREVFRQADSLSENYALFSNCRTLDILHVACGLLLESDEFVSFDKRQRDVAKRAGLRIMP